MIYVAGEPFRQCKKLLLDIPIDKVEEYDDIQSIDDVAERLKWDTAHRQEGVEYDISPETEFIGHCSNLEVFCEYGYDTRLLHSNIAFPLLKRLAAGLDIASIVGEKN